MRRECKSNRYYSTVTNCSTYEILLLNSRTMCSVSFVTSKSTGNATPHLEQKLLCCFSPTATMPLHSGHVSNSFACLSMSVSKFLFTSPPLAPQTDIKLSKLSRGLQNHPYHCIKSLETVLSPTTFCAKTSKHSTLLRLFWISIRRLKPIELP